MTKAKIITTLRNKLKSDPKVIFGYLFGSQSYGNTTRESDVDVAVFLAPKEAENFFDLRLKLMEKLSRALSRKTDVIILNTAPPFLKFAVLKEGTLAYSRDEKQRVEFELKALNEYFDFKPIINLYRKRIKAT